MKRKFVRQLLCMTIAVSMIAGTSMTVLAEAETETTAAEETAAETEEEVVITDLVIQAESGEVTVENKTEKNYTVEYTEADKPAAEGEEKKEEPEKMWVLTLTDEDEQKYVFEDVKPEEWNEAALVNELGVLYIFYKDAAKADQEVAEKCEEKTLEEKTTIYTVTNVNVREASDTAAAVIKVSTLGEEFTAVAALPGWVKVELPDGKEGFISHKYVTADAEVIAQLKKAAEEAAAKAKAEAEAAAKAQAEWEAQQSWNDVQEEEYVQPEPQPEVQPQEPVVQEVYEVTREKFDDCDGSGHGYYEITYSDGSVAYEEY